MGRGYLYMRELVWSHARVDIFSVMSVLPKQDGFVWAEKRKIPDRVQDLRMDKADLAVEGGPILKSKLFRVSRPVLWCQLILGRTPYYIESGNKF